MNFFRKTDKVANDDDAAPKNNSGTAVTTDTTNNDTRNDNDNDKVKTNNDAPPLEDGVASPAVDAAVVDATVVGKDAASASADDTTTTAAAVEDAEDVEGERMNSISLDSVPVEEYSPPPPKDLITGASKEEEDSEGEYTDDDSEYTYETVEDDDEELEGGGKKKGGWFNFLKRGKKKKHHEDTFDDDDEEEEEEGDEFTDESDAEEEERSDADIEVVEEDEKASHGKEHAKTAAAEEEEHESSSSDDEDEQLTHRLLQTPTPARKNLALASSTPPTPRTLQKFKEKEKEEEILMAQAIQRVQNRIQSNGGNLYDALSEDDKRLVDSLRGVEDEDAIRKVVAESMEKEEEGGGGDDVVLDQEGGKVKEGTSQHDGIDATNASDQQAGVADTESSLREEPSLDAVEPSLPVNDMDSDDDDDQGPTLEERRSLLSLAAEHDRVDAVKGLLEDAEEYDTLLAGISHNGDTESAGEQSDNAAFVPPPLHAAVAHGSINAASCLLRMGADPSIRPNVPSAYLHPSYNNQPSSPFNRSGSKGAMSMEEDRNYKKYHDMSAWELAFGSTVVVEDGDVDDAEAEEEGEEDTAKRGWFGFGSPGKKENHESVDNVVMDNAGAGKKCRVKRKQPLNIPPAKLEGIKHAFTAEALRAIGSDEVHRLAQLLNAGMDASMEVADKALADWAQELDAKDCCELLCPEMEGEENEEGLIVADYHVDADTEDGNKSKIDDDEAVDAPVENGVEPPPQPTAILDERLIGFSLADIQTLVRENENLLPHLTACQNDLATETSVSQSMLQDIETTGGKGGLSSKALLEIVRTLKDQRAQTEEAATDWQRAWEEREDELDFFWEEVLNEELRAELGGVLDQIGDNLMQQDMPRGAASSASSMEEWAQRFVEVDDQVNALRASIANLAEESSQLTGEIERHGMTGALSLMRSLREEVKEFEKNLEVARAGEEACRSKVEFIQRRLDGYHEAKPDDVQVHQQTYEEERQYPEAYPAESSPPLTKEATVYKKGMEVMYKGPNGLVSAKILDVHFDDLLEPYYTILREDGVEKQTDNGRLTLSTEDYQLRSIAQQHEQDHAKELDRGNDNPSLPVIKSECIEVDEEEAPTPEGVILDKGQSPDKATGSATNAQYEDGRQEHPSHNHAPSDSLLDRESNYEREIVVDDVHDEESTDEESSNEDQNISEHDGSSQGIDEDVDESIGESNDIIEENSTEGEGVQEKELDSLAVQVAQQQRDLMEAEPSDDNGSTQYPDENILHHEVADTSHLNAAIGGISLEMNVQPTAIDNQPTERPTDADTLKPSAAIAEGMSTAIVAHSPNNRGNSLGSQIWEILRRIVGFGQVVSVANSRSGSSHDDLVENHPHIMIV